jgi:hypothetical protein
MGEQSLSQSAEGCGHDLALYLEHDLLKLEECCDIGRHHHTNSRVVYAQKYLQKY